MTWKAAFVSYLAKQLGCLRLIRGKAGACSAKNAEFGSGNLKNKTSQAPSDTLCPFGCRRLIAAHPRHAIETITVLRACYIALIRVVAQVRSGQLGPFIAWRIRIGFSLLCARWGIKIPFFARRRRQPSWVFLSCSDPEFASPGASR